MFPYGGSVGGPAYVGSVVGESISKCVSWWLGGLVGR